MMLPKREKTQIRPEPWPFLYSVVKGRGLVINVPPKKEASNGRPRKKLAIREPDAACGTEEDLAHRKTRARKPFTAEYPEALF